jgi:hypothetical protein
MHKSNTATDIVPGNKILRRQFEFKEEKETEV